MEGVNKKGSGPTPMKQAVHFREHVRNEYIIMLCSTARMTVFCVLSVQGTARKAEVEPLLSPTSEPTRSDDDDADDDEDTLAQKVTAER